MNAEQKIHAINLNVYEKPSKEDSPPYPVEASSWGKNSYYHSCKLIQQSKNFAVCMNIIKLNKNGSRIPVGYSACVAAIDKGTCPAIAMHQEEIDAGRGLYYLPKMVVKRDAPIATIKTRSTLATPDSVERTKHRIDKAFDKNPAKKAKPIKVKTAAKPQPAMLNMDMSVIVKDLMEEEKQPVKKVTPEVKDLTRLSGESPLAFAKRKMALR